MPVHISDPEKLNAWLVNEIRPLTDADPQVLSKYIIAILRKDKQDHKTFCEEQLEVFLGSKSRAFVDRLFSVVHKEGYLGTSSGVSQKAPSVVEPKGGETIKKETKPVAAVDEVTIINTPWPIPVVGRRDVNGSPRARSRTPPRARSRPRSKSPVRSTLNTSSASPQATPVVRCRDFEEKGYCTLGEMCGFDHGPDPLIVENPMRPTGRDLPSRYGYFSEGAKVCDVNGNDPAFGAHTTGCDPQILAGQGATGPTMAPRVKGPDIVFDVQSEVHRPWENNRNYRKIYRRDDAFSKKCSLVIRRIPEELNVLSKLNEYFSRFGNITNVQVKYQGHPETACITFATHEEANAAFISSEAVLNNRFIRVYWDREGSDTVGTLQQRRYRPFVHYQPQRKYGVAYSRYQNVMQPVLPAPSAKNYTYKSQHYLENEKHMGSQGVATEEQSLISLCRSENEKYSQVISEQWRLLASMKIETDPNKRATMKASFEKSDGEVRKMRERIVELSDKLKEVQKRTGLKRSAREKLDEEDVDRTDKEPKMEVDDE
ncbi:hypothetical protein QR680_013703 [Steinernema hermaphroditum]|uniref:C3H1-type domain-containing protein n=1 Tax=Steinernema hermaphroditum TaxID=289476 RepID=A0AA39I6E4_9BILA|nr:hypothetical protein QR680_013703 [Steinernema hermaphroditum]